MSTAATVVIPTHDHGRTLLRSVPSALAQTVSELEVFVVGDGVPDVTRELMAELVAADERVRFFDNPKGERHGEGAEELPSTEQEGLAAMLTPNALPSSAPVWAALAEKGVDTFLAVVSEEVACD